ncbi:MAG: hypothetical protein O7F71_03960 [Gammaproteobacteria bacterium]|nr:hypothetical protein [Gammaproteobacteria bacterium]
MACRKTHPGSNRKARAERLREWFDLQLQLVDVIVARRNLSYQEAITSYTNLPRRFGFALHDGGSNAAEWPGYLRRMSTSCTRSARLGCTETFARTHLQPWASIERKREFGCFNFVPPDDRGLVRIHFAPKDNEGGRGPLSRTKVERRRSELTEMFDYIRHDYPQARYVVGVSWLYNLEAYRRLFPAEYGASRKIFKRRPMTLTGGSTWGQFLDHNENIKPELRDRFLANLRQINFRALWELFPLPAMITRAPLPVFYNFYAIGRQAHD